MNLGTWIETLSALDPMLPVVFAGGAHPGKLLSWRGVYAELSLDTGTEPTTVGAMLKDAKKAVGRTFEGYKGGDYVMRESTPVWADPWGECWYRGIAGVSIEGRTVVIGTADLSDYR